jgi:hypothetical protein
MPMTVLGLPNTPEISRMEETSKQVRCVLVCQHALARISAFKPGIPIKLWSIISLPRNSRSESARSLGVDDRLTMHFDLWLYSSKA